MTTSRFNEEEGVEERGAVRTFDPVKDTNAMIMMIANGKLLPAEEAVEAPAFLVQMTSVLRKLCQAYLINPEDVQVVLGGTFFEAMKQLAYSAWRHRTGSNH